MPSYVGEILPVAMWYLPSKWEELFFNWGIISFYPLSQQVQHTLSVMGTKSGYSLFVKEVWRTFETEIREVKKRGKFRLQKEGVNLF